MLMEDDHAEYNANRLLDLYLMSLIGANLHLVSPSRENPYFSTSSMKEASTINEIVQNWDSDACEAYTRLSLGLHSVFLPYWKMSMLPKQRQVGHVTKRILCSRASLALTLRYLAAGPDLLDMSLLSSKSVSFVSRNLQFGLDCLLRALSDLSEARTGIPTEEYARKVGDIVGKSEGWAIAGCAFVLDGSIHELEKDEKAQVKYL